LLAEADLAQLKQDGLPSAGISFNDLEKQTLTGFLSKCGLALSGREVKDALSRSAVSINGVSKNYKDNMNIIDCFSENKALFGKYFIVKLGKKKYFLFEYVK
jgi:tyrosyl-tRNA synthetase